MSTQDKYSLKRHLLEGTTHANTQYLQSLKRSPNWSFTGIQHSPMSNSWRQHAFSYEATPECTLSVELHPIYDDIVFIERLVGAWGPDHSYDPECEGKGYGTQCMRGLQQLADTHDVQLTLEPYAFNDHPQRPDTHALEGWYLRLGFEHSPQGNGTLVYNFRG